MYGLISSQYSFINTMFNIINIFLLLPLCIIIILYGLQQWQQKSSTSSAATINHSNSLIYHLVIIELIGTFGCILCWFGVYTDDLNLSLVEGLFFWFTSYGQILFHALTCVERYLAVVHPITYVNLRNERGIRIKNISIDCVWLICFAGTCLVMVEDLFIIGSFCLVILSLPIVSLCSLSVLCVLFHPGPDKQGWSRGRVNQSGFTSTEK